jgi:hypothetical protein
LSVLRFAARVVAGASALLGFACSELPPVTAELCGNGVTEAPEECDTYAPTGQACRAPGSVGACRFDCSHAECPQGAGCGTDGICRFAAGTYEPWGDTVPISAQTLLLGDFDGDGRQDLFALGAPNAQWEGLPKLVFFDQAGPDPSVVTLDMPLSSPTVADLLRSGDGRHQIVVASPAGMATLEITKARAVVPIPYTFQALPAGFSFRLATIRGSADSPLHDGVLVFATGGGGNLVRSASPGGTLGTMPHEARSISGEPAAANVVDGPGSPCDEALVAFHGDGNVYMLEPCDSGGHYHVSADPLKTVLALDTGHTIEQGLLAAKIGSDTHVDVFIGDENGLVYAAFGRGDGTFWADPTDAATLGTAWPVQMTEGSCVGSTLVPTSTPVTTEMPLAVGDLNGDGMADLVMPGGVLLVEAVTLDRSLREVRIRACGVRAPFTGRWSVARIADLNGDGLLDVVAGRSEAPDLEVLSGTGKDRLNGWGIGTEQPVRHLSIGDFDGDLVDDVAFAEAEGNAGQRLAIAFGQTRSAPTPPVTIGRFASVEQIASANYVEYDAIDELGVVSSTVASAGDTLSVYVGSPTRHPIAPLGLSWTSADGQTSQSGVPLAAGLVTREPGGYPSVVAVAMDACGASACPLRLWLAEGALHAGLGAPLPSAPLPPEISVLRAPLFILGGAQPMLLSADGTGASLGLWQIDLPAAGAPWTAASPVRSLSSTAGRLVSTSGPQLADLDGDGRPDIVLMVPGPSGKGVLEVVWDDQSTYALDGPAIIDIDGASVRGFAVAEQRGRVRLVAITDDAAYEASAAASHPRLLTASKLPGVSGGKAVALVDVTGDGLLDLVVADTVGVRVFAETAVRP